MTAPPQQTDWLRLDLMLPVDVKLPKQTGRPAKVVLTWHDTPDGTLAARGQTLIETRSARAPVWRLHARNPGAAMVWLSGAQDQVLAEAAGRDELDVPDSVAPLVELHANRRKLRLTQPDVTAVLLDGTLRHGDTEQPVQRLRLSGPATEVEAAALALGAVVPVNTLSDQALALVRPGPKPAGPPVLAASMTVGAAFAHIVAHLTAVIVALAPAACEGAESEPVHQMRVAIRRLRSAISLFGDSVACPAVADAKAATRELAQALAPARAWDVFLAETLTALAAALPEDPALADLRAAAFACREAAYADLRAVIAAPGFSALTIRLACLAGSQPWPGTTTELADFAADALKRRGKKLRAAGRHIARLDIARLHALRLKAKRLRYAAEFFAPLYSDHATRRMLRALADLQEALGHLNDDAAANALLADLPRPLGQGYAGGLLRGFVAGSHANGRTAITDAWKRLRNRRPPWN